MGCSCNKGLSNPKLFVHTAPDGVRTTYSSEAAAQHAADRLGGTVKAK